jgi:hypothetical protein
MQSLNPPIPSEKLGPPKLCAPILVTGAHRTGTTWVGKMLAASGEAAYLSEPLNVWHRPGVLRAPVKHWYTYISSENEADYLPAFQEMLRFRYHPLDEIRSLRSRKDAMRMGRDGWIFAQGWLRRQQPLLKDPFAVFSIPWFAGRLGCQAVVTVRHPAAFASSLKRLNWPFDFSDLLAQPLLMDDLLEPFRAAMEKLQKAPGDVLGQASLLWSMVYQAVERIRQSMPGVLIVRHEDLSVAPLERYAELYSALGLRFTPSAQKAIEQASRAENPQEVSRQAVHSYRLDSRANLDNWKRRLSAEEIAYVRSLTEEVAALYYPDVLWKI